MTHFGDNLRLELAVSDLVERNPPGLRPLAPTVSESRAAWIIGLTPSQLADRRRRGTGPVFRMSGKAAVYRHEDIGAWAEARLSLTGGSPGKRPPPKPQEATPA